MWVIFWQTALIGIEKIKVLVCRRMGDGYQRCSSSHEIVLDGIGLYNEAWKPYRDLILKSRHATASKIIASINELPITTLIPNQSDVVQKSNLSFQIFKDRVRTSGFICKSFLGYLFFQKLLNLDI